MMTCERMKLSLRKNDMVQVIAGREKGKTGKILKVDAKEGRVIVEKMNMVKRHVKATQQSPQGGIVEKESPIHYSNLLLFCSKCNKGVRHGRKLVDKPGKAGQQMKIRVCKRCNSSLDTAA